MKSIYHNLRQTGNNFFIVTGYNAAYRTNALKMKGDVMTEVLEFYKCNICGNLVEVVLSGEGELVCCGQPMEKLIEHDNEKDIYGEKHVPVLSKDGEKLTVRVGSEPHTMEDNHYIQFIEVNSADKRYVKRKYLYPHEDPVLQYKCNCDKVEARELCNIHGLWSSGEMGV